MAGHSKWSNIKRKKGRVDARRARVFTRIGREILVAVRAGGADPAGNPRLKLALQTARAENMPAENIRRIIQKAAGGDTAEEYEERCYEGYGPGGAAVVVDVFTDNRNRTAAEIRHAFDKFGGKLGESGCVSYLFCTRGVITVPCGEQDPEAATGVAIEAGASDLSVAEGVLTVFTEPPDLEPVREALEEAGFPVTSAETARIPVSTVRISEEKTARQLVGMMEMLEECDDVQETWSNFDIDEKLGDTWM